MKILVDTAITVPVNIAQLISDSDFKTIDEGIAYNESGMDLKWNFETKAGVITQTNVTPTTGSDYDWGHVGNGMYKIEIPASGGVSVNNTEEGFGWFSGVCDGVLPFVGPKIQFSPANVINSLVDGSDILQVDAIESNIIDVTPWVPTAIDLSDATVALGLTFTCSRGAVPTTGEMTSGNITIKRKPIGSASWLTVVNSGGCNKTAGRIYYNEVFNAGATYAEGDAIEILFSGQSILVDGKTYTISSSQHYGYIRSASAGANITSINGVAQRATDLAEICQYLLANSLTLTDIIADNSIFAQMLASSGVMSGYSKVDDAQQSIRDAITSANPQNHSAVANNETTGTLDSGTYADTLTINNTYYQTSPVGVAVGGFGLNVDLTLNIGVGRVPDQLTVTGFFDSGAQRTVQVWAYDYNQATYVQVSSSVNDFGNTGSNQSFQYSLTNDMRQASDGEVKIRFTSESTTIGDDWYCDYVTLSSIQQAGAGLTADAIQSAVWARSSLTIEHDEHSLGYVLSNIYLVEGDIVSATSASQFIIDGDYDVDDAYNGMVIVVEDDTTGFYEARRIIDYIGATKEVFLDRALSFTPVADDDFYIMGTGYCDVNVTDISGTSQTANDNGADVNLILADVENINGDAMRGTDGANTVVPDIAGTAAGLHGTTDARIDDLELVSGQLFTIIIEDVAGLNGDAMRGTDGANQIAPNTVIPDVAGTAAGLHSITDGKVDVVDGKLDALLTRLSAVRAGYLDNLSAGAVALEASITAIKGAGWTDENLKTMNTVLDVIAVDVAGINGAAMRGTDSASTHSATDVWAVGTRTLTSFGTLVADIATSVWSKATSALTTVGSIGKKLADWVLGTDDKVILSSDAQTGVTIPTVTTVGNMRGTDGANTVVPDVAGTAAALHVITDGKIDTLLIRLSAVRATYLDNLSAGAVSLQSTLTSLASVSALEATLTDMKGAGWTDENLKTIQDVVEAFTPGGDATASNQTAIAALIAALQGSGFVESEDSNEAIRNRGDAAWITGGGLSGSNAITVNIHDALSVNIVECAVEIWDEAGTAFYERQSSDSNGQCLFNMDSGTYTVKMHKAGYTFSNQVLVVTATAAVTYTGTSFVAPVPVGANTCVVYDIMYAQSGVQFASSASGTAVIISLPYDYGDGLHPGSQLSGTYNSVTGVLSWEIVRGAKVQFSAGVYGMDKIVIIPDQASARLTDIED